MAEGGYGGDSPEGRTGIKTGGHGETIGDVVGEISEEVQISRQLE